jgi:hypothetical protein
MALAWLRPANQHTSNTNIYIQEVKIPIVFAIHAEGVAGKSNEVPLSR